MSVQTIEPEYPVEIEQAVTVFRKRPALFQKTLQRMFREDSELRWTFVIDLYLDEQISLAKGAELLEMHPLQLQQRLVELGLPVYLGPPDIESAQAEIESIKHWLAGDTG